MLIWASLGTVAYPCSYKNIMMIAIQDETDKKYRRLTKSQAVGLKYVGVTLKVLEVVKVRQFLYIL